MPGICGVICSKENDKSSIFLNKMIKSMLHEDFYLHGKYIDQDNGIFIGWANQLNDASFKIPYVNEDGNILLFINGEIFNDKSIKTDLKNRHDFNLSDNSYLVHYYEENRIDFFKLLNGRFNGLIIDKRNNFIFLFNDRYGFQRLYYTENNNNFIFSSEAKSILKIRPDLKSFDTNSLCEYFLCGSVINNKTLFKNIFLLPGGSLWTFKKSKIFKKSYYFLPKEWESLPELKENEYFEELSHTMLNVMPKYFESQNEVGISVTGGLDTRMILACIPESTNYFCHTYGGVYRDCMDVIIGKKMASICRKNHEIINIDCFFLKNFGRYAEKNIYITDGTHDVCGSHDIYLNSKVRKLSEIRVTGKFGGEILRSVSTIKAILPNSQIFNYDFFIKLERYKNDFDNYFKGNILTNSIFKGIPWGMYGSVCAEQSQIIYRCPFLDNDIIRLVYQAPQKALFDKNICLKIIKHNNPELARIYTDRGYYYKNFPLLSDFIKLYYWTLFKIDWYYGVGMPSFFDKVENTSNRYLPLRNILLGTQRIDHYRIWFKSILSEYLKSIIFEMQVHNRPFFNTKNIKKIMNQHVNGHNNFTYEINKILSIELISRLLLEN